MNLKTVYYFVGLKKVSKLMFKYKLELRLYKAY